MYGSRSHIRVVCHKPEQSDMSWLRRAMQVMLFVLLGASFSKADVCHMTDPIQRDECSRVTMLHGAATEIHQSVLRQLCEAGHRHVLLKGAKPSQFQHLPATSPRRAEQFAVFNIHRDDFSDKVNWKSGEAVDIMCNDDWFVDEEVKLTNGYNWYNHGLPLWPLLNQTLVQKKKGLLSRTKKLDWPNYAIGTPFYLVPNEIYNSRDPTLSIQKRFAEDFAQTALPTEHAVFAKPATFKDKVLNLYRDLFLDQTGIARTDITADLDSYTNWLQPLVKGSLQLMLESFLQTQTPKRGQAAICPDELYFFFHQQPCPGATSCPLLNELQLILKLASCPDTKIVVGFGVHGDLVVEEIISTKTLGKAESMPNLHTMPNSDTVPNSNSIPSSAPCNRYTFQTVWYLLALLSITVSSFQFC